MNQFLLRKESKELQLFPHINEFGSKKINTVLFNSLKKEPAKSLRFYYVVDGKYEWVIDQQHYILYPGDLAIILPGQVFGGEKDFLDIGTISWLSVQSAQLERSGKMVIGKWSSISESENRTIGKILILNNSPVLSLKTPSFPNQLMQPFLPRSIGAKGCHEASAPAS